MFIDQVDEKNAMVQSVLAFEKIEKLAIIQVCFPVVSTIET